MLAQLGQVHATHIVASRRAFRLGFGRGRGGAGGCLGRRFLGGDLLAASLLGRFGALAGFCVLAAIFFHWQPGDQMQMINFVKNITIAGGFLVLAGAGPGALALDDRLRR